MEANAVLGLLGNVLVLLVSGWKTFYDLYWNKHRFTEELRKAGEDVKAHAEAAKRKRERGDITTGVAFLFLALSSGILIMEVLMENQDQPVYVKRSVFDMKLDEFYSDFDKRIAKIEKKLFPPGTDYPGESPSPTPPPPPLSDRLDKIDERLQALSEDIEARAQGIETRFDSQLREIIKIVAELRDAVATLEKEIEVSRVSENQPAQQMAGAR